MRRRVAVAALGAGLAGGLGAATAAAATVPAVVGEPLDWPASVTLLDGTRQDAAAWRGHPALVVFWATWCPFCRRHNAHVDRAARAHGTALRVLGAAVDGDAAALAAYLRAHGYGFPVTADGAALRARWGLRRTLPLTLLVDRRGRLLQQIPGEMSADDLDASVAALLRAAA